MSRTDILIVEDDRDLGKTLMATLSRYQYEVECVTGLEEAMLFLQSHTAGLILSDIELGGGSGQDLLLHLRRKNLRIPLVFMTAFGNIKDAVRAIQNGASDYLTKPFETEVLLSIIEKYLERPAPDCTMIAVDRVSQDLVRLAERVAPSDASVMITGPSGSGKEVLAQFIHRRSTRADKPFVAINCAAIPEQMLEAILFGYEKGAYTGAHQASPGKFELAHEGTLLLDEISEMSMPLQAKLLRVIQEREVERLGGRRPIKLDVRLLSTSNRDLSEEIAAGNFREDLYYRLNVFPLVWQSLAERPLDILPLAEYFIEKYSKAAGKKITLDSKAKEALCQYPWPGNVRELENLIQRSLILCSESTLRASDLLFDSKKIGAALNTASDLSSDLKSREFDLIHSALSKYDGDKAKVAKELGISPRTLRYKIAKMRESGWSLEQFS